MLLEELCRPDAPWETGPEGSTALLLRELHALRQSLLEAEGAWAEVVDEVPAEHRTSARNLLHYLALRQRDIRPLQEQLAVRGLSSLGRTEAHVMASLDAVLCNVHLQAGSPWYPPAGSPVTFEEGTARLAANTQALLGPEPPERGVRIMVTMPSEAAREYRLVRDLLAGGMDCMRINCAHDDATAWARMIDNLRRAEAELGRRCRVFMDLAGPKLRTGPLAPGLQVVKWRPKRDSLGRTLAPARIWLTAVEQPLPPPGPCDATLTVSGEWLIECDLGDVLRLVEARGKARTLTITGTVDNGRWAECHKTAYVTSGLPLRRRRSGDWHVKDEALIGLIPAVEQPLILRSGDTLVLTKELEPARPAVTDAFGHVLAPARIGCTLPEVFADVMPGERVWLDDGRIGGVVDATGDGEIRVRITRAGPQGSKLGAQKGINLPDSTLRLSALTSKDVEDLQFVARHADLVGLSFVHHPSAVIELQSRLEQVGAPLGIVLKIETRQAFEQLPLLLFAAMRSPLAGVMIARGDLAVECGYERLAEVQEEILWLTEAAHIPVIWATQVLETLAKKGQPTRAEISDAAMAQRAECVMLNKGPHVVEAVRVLDDILRRMQTHQSKKISLLRQLRAWGQIVGSR